MEDLTNKVLKADFSAKLNLIHHLMAKRFVQWGLITPFLLYGFYSHVGPGRLFSSTVKDSAVPGSSLFFDYIAAEQISLRKSFRPEIYHRELIYFEKKYAQDLAEIVGKDRNYKPFIWG